MSIFRIDKDVQRCDRNLAYFTLANLEKLRNIITTYVWENLDVGYMQVKLNCDFLGDFYSINPLFKRECVTWWHPSW